MKPNLRYNVLLSEYGIMSRLVIGLCALLEKNESRCNNRCRTSSMQLDVASAELDIYREKHTRRERELEETQTQLETVTANLREDNK